MTSLLDSKWTSCPQLGKIMSKSVLIRWLKKRTRLSVILQTRCKTKIASSSEQTCISKKHRFMQESRWVWIMPLAPALVPLIKASTKLFCSKISLTPWRNLTSNSRPTMLNVVQSWVWLQWNSMSNPMMIVPPLNHSAKWTPLHLPLDPLNPSKDYPPKLTCKEG